MRRECVRDRRVRVAGRPFATAGLRVIGKGRQTPCTAVHQTCVISHDKPRFGRICAGFFFCSLAVCGYAQTTPTQQPGQTPKPAPQVEEVLPSYEGQNVSSVELAGRPELNTDQLKPLLAQQAGQPFSRAKVDESIAALKKTGQFDNVRLEIRPDPEGIRVLFILEPAIYFGIYEFPGADNRYSYSRLLQVAGYPPRGAYTNEDVNEARDALETFFHRTGYFTARVRPTLE